jgi:magnesium transporter
MQARILDGDKLRTTTALDDVRAALAAGQRIWIELERHSPEADALLRDDLKLHPLTIEDIWSKRSRPKIDDFDDYLYMIVHGIDATRVERLETVEIDIVLGSNWLVTHDRAGVVSDDIGTELAHSARMMTRGIVWVAHALLDRAVDRYLPVIDQLDAELEHLEQEALDKAGTPRGHPVLTRLLAFRRRLQELRRMSMYQREILLRLSRGEFDEIPAETLPFFRDVYDHFLRINDIAEGYRELVSAALDAYLTVQANRMNEVMKTLTMMSTVMLPLSFIAGLYGMNFKHMPELDEAWAYPAVVGVMVAVAATLLLWFRRRGWIGRDRG